VTYMNRSMYDSAQFVISGVMAQTEIPISKTELYYLHSYESEIMYYNALFEQGLNIALWSLDIANQLGDEMLVGNSENFIGLFLMNLERYAEATGHFKRAVRL